MGEIGTIYSLNYEPEIEAGFISKVIVKLLECRDRFDPFCPGYELNRRHRFSEDYIQAIDDVFFYINNSHPDLETEHSRFGRIRFRDCYFGIDVLDPPATPINMYTGDSAGAAIFLCLISKFFEIEIPSDLAITGCLRSKYYDEIGLVGNIAGKIKGIFRDSSDLVELRYKELLIPYVESFLKEEMINKDDLVELALEINELERISESDLEGFLYIGGYNSEVLSSLMELELRYSDIPKQLRIKFGIRAPSIRRCNNLFEAFYIAFIRDQKISIIEEHLEDIFFDPAMCMEDNYIIDLFSLRKPTNEEKHINKITDELGWGNRHLEDVKRIYPRPMYELEKYLDGDKFYGDEYVRQQAWQKAANESFRRYYNTVDDSDYPLLGDDEYDDDILIQYNNDDIPMQALGVVFKKTSEGVRYLLSRHAILDEWGLVTTSVIQNETLEEAILRKVSHLFEPPFSLPQKTLMDFNPITTEHSGEIIKQVVFGIEVDDLFSTSGWYIGEVDLLNDWFSLSSAIDVLKDGNAKIAIKKIDALLNN